MNHGNVSPEIAKGLLALYECIAASNIPSSKLDESVNIATWNIREFGKKKRTTAAIHYIAEILGQFDLIGRMSDHLPLWMQMNTDIDGFQLEQIIHS